MEKKLNPPVPKRPFGYDAQKENQGIGNDLKSELKPSLKKMAKKKVSGGKLTP